MSPTLAPPAPHRPFPREGRCLGWLGVLLPHPSRVPHPWGTVDRDTVVS
jgi:hypothetical protein